ncbi:DUF6624 domain-containing protein [Agromyces sp. NPDC056523]|uniref:DUF6624 domain-containing protein n=1 Tax=Agromyces sp. NPDC056523 TaxID=3345850 RepID=UPI00366FFE2B
MGTPRRSPRSAELFGAAACIALLLSGCALVGGPASAPVSTSPPPSPTAAPALMPADADPDGELQEELLAMLERDQAGRTGGEDTEGDAARTARLREIMDAHGWPTQSAVGEEAATAAWAIAQHSDLEPEFQQRALELLELAVAEGEGSPGDLAYLTDRVAVNTGQPQTYGTQIGCGPDGPAPSTPIADESTIDERRAEAGLPPLAEYYAELEEICAQEAPPTG